MLRKMKEKDIPVVVKLHVGYIPGALFPKLGKEFMHALYRTMIDLDCAANYVWKSEVGSRESEVGSRKSEVGSRESEVGSEDIEKDGIFKTAPQFIVVKKEENTTFTPSSTNNPALSTASERKTDDGERGGRTVAFITATTNSSKLFKQVLIKNFPLFVWRTFLYLLGNPLRIREVWETVTYSKLAEVHGVTAELLFIAINKNFRKKSISDDLVNKCLEWAKEKGHKKIKVTTYTTNRGANALLERLGFNCARKKPFRDKEINLYVHDLY